jgi:hypothetical protein
VEQAEPRLDVMRRHRKVKQKVHFLLSLRFKSTELLNIIKVKVKVSP